MGQFNGPLQRGEVRVIRHNRLGEGGELNTLATKRNDLLDNLFHRSLTAVEHRTDLNGRRLDICHLDIPFVVGCDAVEPSSRGIETIRLSALTSGKTGLGSA